MSARLPQPASALDAAFLAAFFEDRAAARKTFQALCRVVAAAKVGAQITATKSHVAFRVRTKAVWVPEAHLDGTLLLGFFLPVPVDSPRLRKGAVGSKWSHHGKVGPGAVDDEAAAWVQGALEWDARKP